ncbi:MAG: molybdopterin-guanine dinucleotide biosynthesis protein MobA, partial [Ruminococcus sp.]
MFGNVNVDYKPCKSITQLKSAADYILGRQASQIRDGVVKTSDNLYWGMNCDHDNFARDVQLTRQLFGKKKNRNSILAHKMSILFHPDDNEMLTHEETFCIAKE